MSGSKGSWFSKQSFLGKAAVVGGGYMLAKEARPLSTPFRVPRVALFSFPLSAPCFCRACSWWPV